MSDNEPHIDLTTDDLAFLVERLGTGRPVGLDEGQDELEPPPEVRRWLQTSSERNLRARGVVDGTGRPHPSVAEMVRTAGSPGLVISVSVQRGTIIETTVVAALPDLAVVHAPLGAGVHRLTPLATVDALDRVRTLAELDAGAAPAERPNAPSRTELRLTLELLEVVTEAAERSREDGISTGQKHGMQPEDAATLADLISAREKTHLVTVMHRSPDAHVGVVSWWTAAGLGHWRVDSTARGGAGALALRPTTAHSLLDELRSHLPGALGVPA